MTSHENLNGDSSLPSFVLTHLPLQLRYASEVDKMSLEPPGLLGRLNKGETVGDLRPTEDLPSQWRPFRREKPYPVKDLSIKQFSKVVCCEGR